MRRLHDAVAPPATVILACCVGVAPGETRQGCPGRTGNGRETRRRCDWTPGARSVRLRFPRGRCGRVSAREGHLPKFPVVARGCGGAAMRAHVDFRVIEAAVPSSRVRARAVVPMHLKAPSWRRPSEAFRAQPARRQAREASEASRSPQVKAGSKRTCGAPQALTVRAGSWTQLSPMGDGPPGHVTACVALVSSERVWGVAMPRWDWSEATRFCSSGGSWLGRPRERDGDKIEFSGGRSQGLDMPQVLSRMNGIDCRPARDKLDKLDGRAKVPRRAT